MWVGNAQGFFARNGVGVTLNGAPNANYQMAGLMSGTFAIALATADDVIAYREGQATKGLDGGDLMIVMGSNT